MKNKLFKTEVKKLSDAVVISFYEKGTKRLMGTISATVNHCLICGRASIDQEKKDICDACKMVLDRYNRDGNRLYTRDGGRPEPIVKESNEELSIGKSIEQCVAVNPDDTIEGSAKHLSSSTPIEDTKVRKTKTVVNYNKASDPSLNLIRIENLNDLYSKVDNTKMSIGKMEALLKYAIQGHSYQTIAQKLNIQEISVKNDYNFLSKYNFIINGNYKPSITLKVIHGGIAEAPSNLIGLDKTAYLKLKEYLNNWISAEKLCKETKMQRRTILTYIWRLNNLNLIEKRGTVNKEYRFLTV